MARPSKLISAIRAVLGDRPVLFAALESSARFDEIERLLLARPPAHRAVIAETDGTLRYRVDRVVIDGEYPVELEIDPRTLVVADGASVVAGQPLTAGEVALADTITCLGAAATRERIARELRALVDLPPDLADAVAAPMVSLIDTYDSDDTSLDLMLSLERFLEANEALGDAPKYRGRELVVGYDVLATHREPPVDVFVARAARETERAAREAEGIAQRAEFVADLERRAADGDRAALQHLIVACLDPDTDPAPALPADRMLVCRDARPGVFTLTRAADGTWSLGCGKKHRHDELAATVASVVSERPALEQFLALRPGTHVTFMEALCVTQPGRKILPAVDSYWYRMKAWAHEGKLALDPASAAHVKCLVEAGDTALAIDFAGERLLCPSLRAKELVAAICPPPSNDALDRELLEIHASAGLVAAIVRCRDAGMMSLGEAKSYVESLVGS